MNTVHQPFFSCNPELRALFSVNPDINVEDALNVASCFMSCSAKLITEAEGDISESQAYALGYLTEFSQALLESAIRATVRMP